MRTLYDVLGIALTATPEEIKAAFRNIARNTHPDRNKNNADHTSHFKEACEAYKVLSDPEKRRKYDLGFRPIQSVADLFLRHSAGRRIMRQNIPTAPGAPKPGTDLCLFVDVPEEVLREGGATTIKLPIAQTNGTNESTTELIISIPPNAFETPWCTIQFLGNPGKKDAHPGNLLIHFTATHQPTDQKG